jgi:hypothetical protein
MLALSVVPKEITNFKLLNDYYLGRLQALNLHICRKIKITDFILIVFFVDPENSNKGEVSELC